MSVAAHLALIGSLGPQLSRHLDEEPAAVAVQQVAPLPTKTVVAGPKLIDVGLELPPAAALSEPSRIATTHAQGGDRMARPDVRRAGRGGNDEVAVAAVNLAPRDDEAHLIPAMRSRLERSQTARHRTGSQRRSPEDDQVTPRPLVLTFVADGTGERQQTRRFARTDPSAGAWRSARAGRDGAPPARRPASEKDAERRVRTSAGAQDEGLVGKQGTASANRTTTGAGQYRGPAGLDDRSSARVAKGRVLAVQGANSAPADQRGEQSDTVDAEQEVMPRERALLRASTAGGKAGQGKGGQEGPGSTGSGGDTGPGSRATPLGSGPGHAAGVDPADLRRRVYLRQLWSKIHRSWSARDFPKWAALQGHQGHAIVSFRVAADGSVGSIVLSRRSGFSAFDNKMLAAVRRAAPFAPLPTGFGASLQHQHAFVVSNPAVLPPVH